MNYQEFRGLVRSMRRVQDRYRSRVATADKIESHELQLKVDAALKSLKPTWTTIDERYRQFAEQVLVLRFAQKNYMAKRNPDLLHKCELLEEALDEELAGKPQEKSPTKSASRQTQQASLF